MDEIRNNILKARMAQQERLKAHFGEAFGIEKAKETPEEQKKVEKVMKEFKEGELHSGSKEGKKVTNRKQAVAIALSEAGVNKGEENDFGIPRIGDIEKGGDRIWNGDEFVSAQDYLFNQDEVEKARMKRQVGDIHPQHPTWIWTEYAPGKFDWKSSKGKHHAKKQQAAETGGTQPQAPKSQPQSQTATSQKQDDKKKSSSQSKQDEKFKYSTDEKSIQDLGSKLKDFGFKLNPHLTNLIEGGNLVVFDGARDAEGGKWSYEVRFNPDTKKVEDGSLLKTPKGKSAVISRRIEIEPDEVIAKLQEVIDKKKSSAISTQSSGSESHEEAPKNVKNRKSFYSWVKKNFADTRNEQATIEGKNANFDFIHAKDKKGNVFTVVFERSNDFYNSGVGKIHTFPGKKNITIGKNDEIKVGRWKTSWDDFSGKDF